MNRRLLTLPTLLAGDLPEHTESEFLYCQHCRARYSADRGDYFWLHDTSELRCGQDETPLRLVRERRKLEVIA